MSSSYRIALNNWLSTLDVHGGIVYDIGGSQEPVSKRVKSFNVKECLVFDLENPHKDSPRPDVILDLNKNSQSVAGHYGMGDMVFCLEVFDYIYDPMQAMKTLRNLLSKNGKLYVSFPFLYPQHQPLEDDALRYAPGGIKKLAKAVGLDIVQMIPRETETNALENYIRVERLRAAKHINHNVIGWIVEFKRGDTK